jgi:hypothetical protein
LGGLTFFDINCTNLYGTNDNNGEIRGEVTILQSSLEFDGALLCGKIRLPISTFPVRMAPGSYRPYYAVRDREFDPSIGETRYFAEGTTTREVNGLGVLSGQVKIDNELPPYSEVLGEMFIDVPNPCSDQQVWFMFLRRDKAVAESLGYQLPPFFP